MPAAGGSKSIAFEKGLAEGLRERSTTEVRSGGGGVSHTLSVAGTSTEVKEVVGTPTEEKAAGNASFGEKDFATAAKHYSNAIKQLGEQSANPLETAEVRGCSLSRHGVCAFATHVRIGVSLATDAQGMPTQPRCVLPAPWRYGRRGARLFGSARQRPNQC